MREGLEAFLKEILLEIEIEANADGDYSVISSRGLQLWVRMHVASEVCEDDVDRWSSDRPNRPGGRPVVPKRTAKRARHRMGHGRSLQEDPGCMVWLNCPRHERRALLQKVLAQRRYGQTISRQARTVLGTSASQSFMKRVLVVALMMLTGCSGLSPDAQDSIPVKPEVAPETWEVIKVTDGDTIDVLNDQGLVETVRFIGIDTPEVGRCGFLEASMSLAEQVEGQRVTLVEGGTDNRDRYNRLLRYVEIMGVDTGLELIKAGWAISRYDSRDGYAQHLRESAYILADNESPNQCPDSAWQRG